MYPPHPHSNHRHSARIMVGSNEYAAFVDALGTEYIFADPDRSAPQSCLTLDDLAAHHGEFLFRGLEYDPRTPNPEHDAEGVERVRQWFAACHADNRANPPTLGRNRPGWSALKPLPINGVFSWAQRSADNAHEIPEGVDAREVLG